MKVLILAVLAMLAGRAGAQGWVCAEGGGGLARGDYQSPVFAWMLEKAREGWASAPVRVAVLGVPPDAPGDPNDPPPVGPDRLCAKFLEAGFAEALDLRIGPEDADTERVYEAIAGCRVVFMRGGSQSEYVKWWRGTRTERAIREVFDRGGVVGGSSAGCAVLGELVYDAFGGSCAARDALRDARTGRISLTSDFLGLSPGVLFDTHFIERGRIGRLPVMLAQARLAGRDVVGVGVDPRTAFCIGPDGVAEVIGQGSVTILELTERTRLVVEAGRPPVVTDVRCDVLLAGMGYDTRRREVRKGEGVAEDVALIAALRVFGAAEVDGADEAGPRLGSVYIRNADERDALVMGRLELEEGTGEFGPAVIQTRAFDTTENAESRVGGMLYGLAREPGLLGLMLMSGTRAKGEPESVIRVVVGAGAPASAVLVDSREVTSVGFARERHNERAAGARQSVALLGLWLHVLAPGWGYEGGMGEVVAPAKE